MRHVFTKPVQIDETILPPPPSNLFFSSYVTFLPLSDASVCSEKMTTPGKKSFCMLEYHTSKSVVTAQRAFRANYTKYFCHVTSPTKRHGSLQQ